MPGSDQQAELERNLLQLSDAFFGFAGVISRALVEAGIASRTDLAQALEAKAAPAGADDHNALLAAFARSLRMNLPGGRFEVIEGGKLGIDPTDAPRDDD